MFVVRDHFSSASDCGFAADTFARIGSDRVVIGPEPHQRMIQYGALRARVAASDDAGRARAGDDDETRLKIWLNTLRATVPQRAGYRGPALIPELTVVAEIGDGGAMAPHLDHPWRALSAILYLGDAFAGGRTCFDGGEEVTPATGRLVLFAGSKVRHWVSPVAGGVRRTVSLWWSTDAARLEA